MQREIRKIYRLLFEADARESKLRKRLSRNFFSMSGSFLWIGGALLALLLASIVSAIVGEKLDMKPFTIVALFFLAMYYLLCFWLMFGDFVMNYKVVFKSLSNPLSVIFDNSRICAICDEALLLKLKGFSRESLTVVRGELKSEMEAFNKRMSLIIGVMEKVGVLPGILSLIALVTKLNEAIPSWAYSLVYALAGLYLLGLVAHFSLLKAERYVGIFDAVLDNENLRKSPLG